MGVVDTQMDIRIWGPHAWEFMHAASFAFPPNPSWEERQAYGMFYHQIAKILPCEECRAHFTATLTNMPPQTQSRDTLTKWLVDVHNAVNVRLGKPTVPYATVAAKYASMQGAACPVPSSCVPTNSSDNNNMVWIGVSVSVIVVALLCYMLTRQRRR